MAALRPNLPANLMAGLLLVGLSGGLSACKPAPLEVPVKAWTRAWPEGELPDGVVGCLVIQRPRELFARIEPALSALGLGTSAASLDPSGRGLTLLSGAVWLDPKRFDVPMVMAFDISDPDQVVAWQRRRRRPLAAVGATSVWAPRGFDADRVFRSGAGAIPDRSRPMLFLRLTDQRLVSAFDPASLGLSAPYLLARPAELGRGPAARLRLRPAQLHRGWAALFPDERQFWSTGAAELGRRLGDDVPDWIGRALPQMASLVAQLRWLEVDLVLWSDEPHLTARLAFEAGADLAGWPEGAGDGGLDPGAVWARFGLGERFGQGARAAGVSVSRRADVLVIRVPL